jgi:hypothetical protein
MPTSSRIYRRILSAILITLAPAYANARKLPHYVFILPDGYTGWVQIIFRSPGGTDPPQTHDKIKIVLEDSGVYKTGMYHAYFTGSHDEFLYRRIVEGKESLVPIPASYYCNADSGLDTCYKPSEEKGADGFTVGRSSVGKEGPSSGGNSWFFFIGPPELRAKNLVRVTFEPGTKKWMDHPENDPAPGRIKNAQ